MRLTIKDKRIIISLLSQQFVRMEEEGIGSNFEREKADTLEIIIDKLEDSIA